MVRPVAISLMYKAKKIIEIDRSRVGGGKRPALGGSLFSATASSAPPEYQAILTLQASTSKAEALATPAATKANSEYDTLADPSAATPMPLSVHASRLNALFQTLASAEGAVAESIKARKALVEGVEKILAKNKEVLAIEESQMLELNIRKTDIFSKMQAVEAEIMQGISERPDVESITPVGTPKVLAVTSAPGLQPRGLTEPDPLALAHPSGNGFGNNGDAGLTSILPQSRERPPTTDAQDEPKPKKAKIAILPAADYAEFEGDGVELDADVEALLEA
jgi:regulator of Ty1 transposition protein 103